MGVHTSGDRKQRPRGAVSAHVEWRGGVITPHPNPSQGQSLSAGLPILRLNQRGPGPGRLYLTRSRPRCGPALQRSPAPSSVTPPTRPRLRLGRLPPESCGCAGPRRNGSAPPPARCFARSLRERGCSDGPQTRGVWGGGPGRRKGRHPEAGPRPVKRCHTPEAKADSKGPMVRGRRPRSEGTVI